MRRRTFGPVNPRTPSSGRHWPASPGSSIGAAAGAAPGPGGGQAGGGPFADQGGLELGQRPEDVEDQQPGRVVVSIPSVRDRNPTPAVARSVLTVPIR